MEPSDEVAPSREVLARAARSGGAWAITQSVLSKVSSLIGQVLLGWFLTEGDLGLVATSVTVLAVMLFLNPPLAADVLLQRKRHFAVDAPAMFWLALAGAAATSVAMGLVAIPIAAWLESPGLLGVLLVTACTPIATALQIVPLARLRIDLELGAIARWSILMSIGTTTASVLLAALGWGPYSIVVPAALVGLVATIGFARRARLFTGGAPVRSAPWRALARSYAAVSGGEYIHSLTLVADYLALALFASTAELGLYYFAFRLAAQVNGLLAYNTSIALQPVLVHLDADPEAQTRGFLSASRVVASVAVPLSLLQAALAEPTLRLVFEPRWLPTAPMIALISVAQALGATTGPTQAMLKAQGRFHTYALWQVVHLAILAPVLLFAAAIVGPWLRDHGGIDHGQAIAVAASLILVAVVVCPVGLWWAIRGRGGRRRDLVRVFVVPVAIGLPAAVVAAFCASISESIAPASRVGSLVAIAAALAAAIPILWMGLRLWSPDVLATMLTLARRRAA